MGQIEVIRRNGDRVPLFSREPYFSTVQSAQLTKALMGDDYIKLSIVSSQKLEFTKGDKIIFGGDEYFVRTIPGRTIQSENHFVTEVTFYGVVYDMMKSLYRNTDANGRSSSATFDLTYGLRDFINVVLYNLNRDYPGIWAFDAENCPDTTPMTMSFSNQNCLTAIQTICQAFGYEFRIKQIDGVRTIQVGTFGSRVVPPGGAEFFEWGRGNGLFSLKEDKIDDKAIITRLWIEGGSTNIRTEYRDYAGRLQLPYPKRKNAREHKLWDGTTIAPNSEWIGIDDDTKRYIEDEALRNAIGSEEDGYQNDEIYPKRTGSVTAVVPGDELSFIDETMDFDLNEKNDGNTVYLINGVSAKVNFISGKLAGQQFELSKYDPTTKKFTIIPFTDERGLTVPTKDTDAFQIQETDQYKLTDIYLPESYERSAEEDLWYDGFNQFKPRTQARVQYTLTLDRGYFLDNLPGDGDVRVFDVGDYVPVKDERFGIEKTIRISKVVRNLLIEQDYQLTLADEVTINIMTQTVLDVMNHEQVIIQNRLRDLSRAKRGWRTTEELRNMVYDTDGYFDAENIRPNSIDTNMLTVGSKSQQFVLTGVVIEPNYNGDKNVIHISDGVLSHLTISADTVKTWNMGALDMTLTSPNGYYVFAKCPKNGENGTWYITQQQLKVENTEDPNNFYFQVGILGSAGESDTWRDFVTTYGFTRINGNTITTGKIVTSDGGCYLDLDGNKFRIGDNSGWIDWNSDGNRKLKLHNVVLISGSGDENPIGVYRGAFNPNYIYYKGDEVSYTNSQNETYTIRYINPTPSAGSNPEDSNFWNVVARGIQGSQGNSIFYTFNDQQSQPDTPTGAGNTNGWHTNSTQSVVWMSIKSARTIEEGAWGIPFRVRGADGTSLNLKGTLSSVSELPVTGNNVGDGYLIGGNLYIWDGVTWQNVGRFQGENGRSSYLHIKFSNDGGVTFTDGNGETPGEYIGILVDLNPQDSDNPADYRWYYQRGEQGIPGEPGEDGRTPYLHIKYSNDGGMSFTGHNGEDPGDWIGQYTDFEIMDSENPADYTWSKIKGESAIGGVDATAPEYYEYRYAKNGSTTVAPELDNTAIEPAGWSLEQPPLAPLEYLWMTMARKNTVGEKSIFNFPIKASDGARLVDTSGNGYHGTIGAGATLVESGDRVGLRLQPTAEAVIPKELPFGTSFTLCFYLKTDQDYVQWMINGFMGREYVEKKITLTANSWVHLAFRFSGNSVTVFKNGVEVQTGSTSYGIDGFSVYDDNMFGSVIEFDEIRLLKGALSDTDIYKVMTSTADNLVSRWSVPIRTTPYDAISVRSVDVEYTISDSSTEAPTEGWQTLSPPWQDGMYIWSRTKVEYTRGDPTYSDPVCITGKQGNTGNGIRSITEEYYKSTSADTPTGGSWREEAPAWQSGYYIWTRSRILYTNGKTEYTQAICVTGNQGEPGTPGKDGLSVNYNLLDGSGFVKNLDKWVERHCNIVEGLDGNKAALAANSGSNYIEMLKQPIYGSVKKIEPDTWYTLSFWAKGIGKVRTHFYPNVINYGENGIVDGVEKALSTDNGNCDWALDSSYTLHTYTFKTASNLADENKYVLFRLFGGYTAYICMPKLEKGKEATSWCVSEIDKIGNNGDNGYNSAIIHLYKRAASASIDWNDTLTYDFAQKTLSPVPNGWRTSVPPMDEDGNPCWITAATAASRTNIDTISPNEWATPQILSKNGETVVSHTVTLYKRSSTTPAKPTGAIDYYFQRNDFYIDGHIEESEEGCLNGWSLTIPSGSTQCWTIQATALGDPEDYDTIEASEWSEVARYVKDGSTGATSFKSTVFKRQNGSPGRPAGGSFSNPLPDSSYEWSDGIPEGTQQLWATTRIFTSDGRSPQQSTWTIPQCLTNTADLQIKYSTSTNIVGDPSTQPDAWTDTPSTEAIWMAIRTCANGVWSGWVVSKIKGEDGTSVTIKGTASGHYANKAAFQASSDYTGRTYGYYLIDDVSGFDSNKTGAGLYMFVPGTPALMTVHPGDGWLFNSYLFVYSDDKTWVNVGQIKGDKGEPGKSYAGTDEYYQWHTSGTAAPTGTWSKNVIPDKPSAAHKFLWNYEVIKDDRGGEIPTPKHVIGSDGKGINNVEEFYMLTSTSSAPTADDGGWKDYMLTPSQTQRYLWNKEICHYTDGTSNTTIHLIACAGKNGTPGAPGAPGLPGSSPALVYLGEFDPDQVYYGTSYRVDAIKYGGAYYVASVTAGEFSGEYPGDGSEYWNPFGATFESIATYLLLAENAAIAGWIFKDGYLISKRGKLYVDGSVIDSTDYTDPNYVPNVTLDGVSGVVRVGRYALLDADNGLQLLNETLGISTQIVSKSVGSVAALGAADYAGEYSFNAIGMFYKHGALPGQPPPPPQTFFTAKNVICECNLGYMEAGATFRIGSITTRFVVPEKSNFTVKAGLCTIRAEIYKDSVLIDNVTLGSANSGKTSGETVELTTSLTLSHTIGSTRLSDNTTVIQPGSYTVKLIQETSFSTISIPQNGNYPIGTLVTVNISEFGVSVGKKCLIGNDGLYVLWGSNKFFFVSFNEGMTCRFGNAGIRVTSAGLQKLNSNGAWVTL